MSNAARHKLRTMFRLAALLILLGLGTIPVECSAVYGPHSVFVSASTVADLRTPVDAPGAAAASSHTHTLPGAQAHHERHLAKHGAASDRTPAASAAVAGADAPRAVSDLPSPAGAASDVLVSLALLESAVDVTPSGSLPLPLVNAQPLHHQLPAPEPPPP